MNKKKTTRRLYLTILGLFLLILSLSATEAYAAYDISSALRPLKALGISGLKCNDCSYTMTGEADGQYWVFNTEPKITKIDPEGPAKGKLKRGDVIVAVDGMLITTRRAGLRLANITPGEEVEITVRRLGRDITYPIVPRRILSDEDVTIEGFDSSIVDNIAELSKAIELLAKHPAAVRKEVDKGTILIELPGVPDLPIFDFDGIIEGLISQHQADGWFGFKLSFNGSLKRQDEGPSRWSFNEPPTIKSVEPDSPADRAGLQVGDVLTHIDGAKLDSRRGGKLFSDVQPGESVVWSIRRGGERLEVEAKAVERPLRRGVSLIDFGTEDKTLRYSGTLGTTEVEVKGDSSVKVEVDEERGEIVITSRGATVRLKTKDKKD